MNDAWVARHPYLEPIAEFRASVDAAATNAATPIAVPNWQDYVADFHDGIALLNSEHAALDVPEPDDVVRRLLEALLPLPMPPALARQCEELRSDLRAHPALFRCLLWAALARDLEPVAGAFASWRDEERWLRNYCPTCGAPPAMAQLVGNGDGRLRLLSCGCCTSRWRYRRTGCPFCEHVDDHRLRVMAIEGEGGLRLDYCERCLGYLKTYDGQGREDVLLADWTSLHLDVLATDRGLKRLAASLYQP
jgi:FdhE protein